MAKKVDFASAFKKEKAPEPTASTAPLKTKTAARAASRDGKEHIGGYFDPAVARQLGVIAAEERSSVQSLLGQALNMLFHDRRKPTIADESDGKRQRRR